MCIRILSKLLTLVFKPALYQQPGASTAPLVKQVPGICALALVVLQLSAVAQQWNFQRRIDPFPLRDETGQTLDLPLTGGMNRPVHQFVDIDNDGDPDLFVQDRASLLTFFRNDGSATQYDFEWVTDQYQDLVVGEWFKFADIDNDGDFDFMAENFPGAIRYYRNAGSPQTALFVKMADSLRDSQGNFIAVEPLSIPDWNDIDCDNDLDLFLGRQSGEITFYRFTGLDASGMPVYEFVMDRWENLLILTGGKRAQDPAETRHGANSMTFEDIDGDADPDLFWGDFFALSMIHLVNNGTCQAADFDPNAIIEIYPPNDPVNTGGYNVPRFADIDADNDLDMFVGVLGGQGSFITDLADNFYFYRNTGSPTSPNFVLETRQFISSIDIGRNTLVALADIDGDGDLDLFISNEEDLAAPDHSNSRIYFFENQGSPTLPQFHLVSRNYLNYDKRYDLNYAPVFADLDGDSDLDMLLGKWNGKFTYYRNDGTPQQPQFTRVDENYFGLDVGNNSNPAMADLDGDGDLDIIAGEANGNLNLIRNDGSATAPNFVLVDENYMGIHAGAYSAPTLLDVDHDGDADLLLGSDTSNTVLYRNTGTREVAQFTPDPDFILPLHLRTDPFLADIDADGDLDLFSGVSGGGIVFYQNGEPTGIAGNDDLPVRADAIRLLTNYPNPFNGETVISYELRLASQHAGKARLKIFNNIGQQIRQWEFTGDDIRAGTVTWDGRDERGLELPSGIYFYRLDVAGVASKAEKMLLTR